MDDPQRADLGPRQGWHDRLIERVYGQRPADDIDVDEVLDGGPENPESCESCQ